MYHKQSGLTHTGIGCLQKKVILVEMATPEKLIKNFKSWNILEISS